VPTFDELPPVTVEEYEALRERISMVEINLYVEKIAIQLQLADHRITGLPRKRKYLENRVSRINYYIYNVRIKNTYLFIIN
jgi:vacuolar protein sorting-associated protein 13B